ncbi:hypothetical protein VKT23_006625 [Stygiomarasmius scandens]|uniref:Uncharacterized protein n=1 Tax=Marasmiellus scandens TaxID=2682957 RepID=A0ABR1JND9_9AGAR
MLTGAGIECWIAKSGSASEEIPHGDSTTTVNDEGVTTVRTTVPLSDNGLNSYHLYWRKAEGAEPQSLWCVVKWESPTGRAKVESQVWMSKSNPESQSRSTKDQHQGSGHLPRVRKILSTQSMGQIRLELQRVKGDVTSKRDEETGVDEIEYDLEDDDKLGPWCTFVFLFQSLSGPATPVKEKEPEDGSIPVSPEPKKTKKRSRPRVSLKVTPQAEGMEDQEGQERQEGQDEQEGLPPPAQKRKTTRNPKTPRDETPKTSKPRRASSGGGKVNKRSNKKGDAGRNLERPEDTFCPPPPPPFGTTQRMQSMPPPIQNHEVDFTQRMQSMPPPSQNGEMGPPGSLVRMQPSYMTHYPAYFPPSDQRASISAPPGRAQSPSSERSFPPMDFTYVNRELQEAEAILRREQDESVALDAQIAQMTKAQTAKVMEQAARIQSENEAKRRWLQALREAGA